MVCASALSFLGGKICSVQEPSIIIIIINQSQSVCSKHRAFSTGLVKTLAVSFSQSQSVCLKRTAFGTGSAKTHVYREKLCNTPHNNS